MSYEGNEIKNDNLQDIYLIFLNERFITLDYMPVIKWDIEIKKK